MKEQLISFDVAKLAKEKGFYDKNIIGTIVLITDEVYTEYGDLIYLSDFISSKHGDIVGETLTNAPTQSLLQKWLREEYKIEIKTAEEGRGYKSWYKKKDGKRWVHALGGYTHKPTYEEALEEGLQEALKLIK